jgi:hypothetical protein
MARPQRDVIYLFSGDGPVIDGEIIEERTQADIQRDWRAAKARARETIAAVREQSAEERAAEQVARGLREMKDVVGAYRRAAEADLEADRLAKEDMQRRARREQERRAGLIGRHELHAELDRRDGVLLDAMGEAIVTLKQADGIVTKGSRQTVVELWPEEGENKDRFMARCVADLTKCIGESKAVRVCRTKWARSEKLGKKSPDAGVFVSRELAADDAVEVCGGTCTGCDGADAPFGS